MGEGLIFARCLWNHICSGNSRCSASLSISHQIGHKNVLQMWGTCLTYTQYEANKAESQSQFIIPFIEPILKSWFVHWWRHADFCVIYRVAHVVFFLLIAQGFKYGCPSRSHSNLKIYVFVIFCGCASIFQDDISIHEHFSCYETYNTVCISKAINSKAGV